MDMEESYYDVLELEDGASQEEVKASFRALALESHPDKKGSAEVRLMKVLRSRAA
jgi:DnaJ-class molecular chaperone